jgi:TolA-binding protein
MKRFLPLLLIVVMAFSMASCARWARKNPDNFYFGAYSEAEALFNRREYEKAIQKYQAYIDENPEGNLAVISQYYMAKSYAAIGKVDEAKSLYEKIVQNHSNLVWANFSETQLKELNNAPASANTSTASKAS